jgi:3-(3-hydroxy-phenyl)propionate hydroxylase
MLKSYTYPKFAFRRPPELDGGRIARVPLVVVGAGPVGLAAAIDARLHGLPVLLLDDDDTVSVGSRGLCYAKRALEILDRLGAGDPVVAKGVNWSVGRTFFGENEVFRFDLLPESGHKRPGMVNLQQYYLEDYLVRRCEQVGVDLRWRSKVTAVTPRDEGATLRVQTPEGDYLLDAAWVIVADGARSPIRNLLGLDIEGKVFRDRFLIADVVMKAQFPAERWFWFDPPFHRNQSVLLHREADDVWRIDFQLGWDADPEEEKKPEKVIPRIRAMLGDGRDFELEWVSVYTFQCRRMSRFNHGRVLFAGDAAHQVSPFGARGANSGIQDADNLVWKLALVIQGLAPARLLDTYSDERVFAADENIMNSTRSTDFITPKSSVSKTFRNAVLQLAGRHPFARKLVNSGRLSVPSIYDTSPLNTPDDAEWAGMMGPGAPMDDAPVQAGGTDGWLLDRVGNRFRVLMFTQDPSRIDMAALRALSAGPIGVAPLLVTPAGAAAGMAAGADTVVDAEGLFARRYDARDGSVWLVRPDQHICARWRSFDPSRVRAAVARATCNA